MAKPVIDIVLVVANSADEDWYEHRMFKGPEMETNLHVYSSGCPEIDRTLLFRDWLRSNAADRDLYERTKLALAQKEWQEVQDYADAKTEVIKEIISRARAHVGRD
jgi:GrpB-like predicted nucleotidyltransferase (UPF0157 family)